MVVVGHPQPQRARPCRMARPAALDAVLVGHERLRVEAEARVEPVVVEQHQPADRAGLDLDLALRTDRPGRRRSRSGASSRAGSCPCPARRSAPSATRQARGLVRRGIEEGPLQAERVCRRKSSDSAMPCGPADAAAGLANRLARGRRRLARTSRPPSTRSGRAGSGGRASSSRSRSRDRPSTSRRPGLRPASRGRATTRFSPRSTVRTIGLCGRVLPRAVDRARARDDHHVAGRRAGGAADRGDQVEPVAAR